MIESAIYQLLLADAAVSAVVGEQIYPDVADSGVIGPYLVYQLIGGDRPLSVACEQAQRSALIQIDAYAADAEVARGVSESICALFHGQSHSAAGYQIQIGLLQGEPRPGYEADTGLRRQMLEFVFYFH